MLPNKVFAIAAKSSSLGSAVLTYKLLRQQPGWIRLKPSWLRLRRFTNRRWNNSKRALTRASTLIAAKWNSRRNACGLFLSKPIWQVRSWLWAVLLVCPLGKTSHLRRRWNTVPDRSLRSLRLSSKRSRTGPTSRRPRPKLGQRCRLERRPRPKKLRQSNLTAATLWPA